MRIIRHSLRKPLRPLRFRGELSANEIHRWDAEDAECFAEVSYKLRKYPLVMEAKTKKGDRSLYCKIV